MDKVCGARCSSEYQSGKQENRKMELVLATRNRHKAREFRELLGRDFSLIDLSSFPQISMPDETGMSFAENASLKASGISKHIDRLVIADDSGLEVDALGGAPGIFSARYAGENASDKENIEKLLSELDTRSIPAERRTARFRCVIAIAKNGRALGAVEGIVEGKIVDPPRGFDQTFAEMASEEKNKISHRAKAVTALREERRALKG
jgi:XTP/dITP diphosphohydrolase